jgi:hypothetical protein
LRVLLPLLSTAAQWDKFPSSTAQGEVISVWTEQGQELHGNQNPRAVFIR